MSHKTTGFLSRACLLARRMGLPPLRVCLRKLWGDERAQRIHPAVPGVFRKTRVDVNYNGYLVPEGKSISWNIVHGLRAESIYPEPRK